MDFYKVKVKTQRLDERGVERNVTDVYVQQAVSYTDAEARIVAKCNEIYNGKYLVLSINKTNITIVLGDSVGDFGYLAKADWMTVDDVTGKEKRITETMLLFAYTLDQALGSVKDYYTDSVVYVEITGISKTNIIELFGTD